MDPMTKEDRDIQRKLKVLRHAEKTGDVAKTCRYYGVGQSSFYRWKTSYDQRGEAGLVDASPFQRTSQPNSARDRRQSPLPAKQISPRVDQDRLVPSALPRHHNL